MKRIQPERGTENREPASMRRDGIGRLPNAIYAKVDYVI